MSETITSSLPTHHSQFRIYYPDTDAGGIVYHAHYLPFVERARTEWMRALGYSHIQLLSEFNMQLVVRRVEIDYLAPAKLDDVIDVESILEVVGNTSLTFRHLVKKEGKILTDMKVVLVGVAPNGRPVRLPPQLRQIFLP